MVTVLISFLYTGLVGGGYSIEDINGSQDISVESPDSHGYPDVYHIIVDGYTGKEQLRRAYGYSNDAFYEYLVSRGFNVVDDARSNYSQTILSLTSIMNMEYIDSLCDHPEGESKNRIFTKRALKILQNSEVLRFLRSKGYRYVHFQSGNSVTHHNSNADMLIGSGYLHGLHYLLLRNSLLASVAPRMISGFIGNRILHNFEKLGEVPDMAGPKFVFAHFLSPHPPYFAVSDDGSAVARPSGKSWDVPEQKRLYLDQIELVNKLVMRAVDTILAKSKVPPVIIIQSDHGGAYQYEKRSFLDKDYLAERMNTIDALYLEGKKAPEYFKNISAVNTFRAVFNFVFGANYELLNNISYYSEESGGPCALREMAD
jgi:hypothetical protein